MGGDPRAITGGYKHVMAKINEKIPEISPYAYALLKKSL